MSEIVKSSRFMLMEAADNAQILAEINGEMLAVSHEDAVYFRIGKRHFGCSVCDYTSWSHKWVDDT